MLKPGYAPFEQYSVNGNQGPWTDVYGLCATIYKCITWRTPPEALGRVKNDTLVPPSRLNPDIPPGVDAVLMYGLEVYPEKRCKSIDELARLLKEALNGRPAKKNGKSLLITVLLTVIMMLAVIIGLVFAASLILKSGG